MYLLCCVLVFPSFLVGRNGDSIKLWKDNSITHYFSAEGFEFPGDSLFSVENGLNSFQNYLVRNNMGNVGMAVNDGVWKESESGIGFRYFKNNYQNYFYLPENIKFYNTRSPFSDLMYVAGSKKEGYFKMTFAYNIKKNWNITVDFSRIRSEGFYKRSKTLGNFIGLSTNYKGKNNRYWLLVSGGFNSIKNEESGGVMRDSDFVNRISSERILTDMNLQSAKQGVMTSGIMVKQYLNMGTRSEDTASLGMIIPANRFILISTYNNLALKYADDYPLGGFYKNVFYDSVKTFDTTFTYSIGNELEWKRVDNGNHIGFFKKIGFGGGIKDELIRVKQRAMDSVMNNIILKAELFNLYSDYSLNWKGEGRYIVNGCNKGDFKLGGIIRKKFFDSIVEVTFRGSYSVNSPDFIFNKYASNNFFWNNNFDKTKKWNIGGDFEMKRLKMLLGANYTIVQNDLYFDNFAIARQYSGAIPMFSSYLKKDFKLGNWHLDNSVLYQYVPDSMVIRVPSLILNHSLYFSINKMFKGALDLQIGASVYYNSAYYANAYMPATGEFYLQNDAKYGNYPFIDFFVNAKIKAVRVFVKIDHLNSGFTGSNYMITPHYPINERAFKLGVSWRFWD